MRTISNRHAAGYAAATLLAFFAGSADATHFRYGQITWVPDEGLAVRAVVLGAWRRDAYTTSNGRCINPLTLGSVPCSGVDDTAGVGDIVLEAQGTTAFNWGDGSPPVTSPLGSLLYLVTSVDPTDNWLFGFAIDPDALPIVSPVLRHTYPSAGDYVATVDDCCRISSVDPPNEHINNPDMDYRVETLIDAGSGNRSPVSVLPPIVNCPADGFCGFPVLGVDQDGDPLRYRLSTSAEASGEPFPAFVQPGPPFAPDPSIIGNLTGTYTWATTGAQLAGNTANNTLYSTQVTILDPTSKTALDLMIRLVDDDSAPPVFIPAPGELPLCESVEVAQAGTLLQFDAIALDPDLGDEVVLNVVGLPFGSFTTPRLPAAGNPVSARFHWIPGESQGSDGGTPYALSFIAQSSGGLQAVCPVIIEVFTGVPCDIDGDEDVDASDIGLIFDARNTPSDGPEDPRDINSDGWISVLDARICTNVCDSPDCAELSEAGGMPGHDHWHKHGEQQ